MNHSIRAVKQPLPQNVVKSNKQYYDIISAQFTSVSRDLQGLNAHRYARQISGGCQEWMEAASFQHYLTTAKLLTYEESVALMRSLDPDGPGVELSPEDYMLGIYDMTGELMRFSITAMATNGALPLIKDESEDAMTDVASVGSERSVLNDMRALRSALEAFNAGHGPFAKDSDKKMEVMRQSVEKVERSL
jgi:predicted translin family RNA/ssDNA-binding protein